MTHRERRKFFKETLGLCCATGIGSLALGSAALGGAALAQEPVRQVESANIRFGLAAYSFRQYFAYMKGKPQTPIGKKLTMFDFIEYCAKQKCAAELTSYFFPTDADEAYFLKIKRHAFLHGVPIVGTAIGNNFTLGKGPALDKQIADAKAWIDRAAWMGAPHVRFFAGTRKQLESSPEKMETAIGALQTCCDYASKKGVFIGMENHGDLTADQVLQIVKGVDSDWFGVNLDTGNFFSEDPYSDLEKCLPFAVNIQAKVKMKRPDRSEYEADFSRLAKLIASSKYRGYVVLEFEESDPMKHVPGELQRLRAAFELLPASLAR